MEELSKHLSKLKDLYRNKRVSVLVGAGFSKNACSEYPSWNELLYDMVVELYPDEIETAWLRYLNCNPSTPPISTEFHKFQKEEVERLLSRKGYLRVVSDYIERKGFRESIEHYIEERVPYIDAENNQFRFSGKNEKKVISIQPDSFLAHVGLLKGEGWERIYTTNYDKLLEYAADASDPAIRIKTITAAHDLSVDCKDPTIIKLHGDLYNPLGDSPRDFSFDGNSHQQYIISEEDYKNYPKDHEAFTQLMRISLLQGYFCLIGFSGDDPNFVNWIEWVRDVLVKADKNREEQYDKKIFLIALSKDLPPLDKQLFYDNHKIVYIPLMNDEIISLIKAKAEDSPRELFVHLFDYLKPEEEREVAPAGDGKEMDHLEDPESPHEKSHVNNKQRSAEPQENGCEAPVNNKQRSAEPQENGYEDRTEYLHLWNRVYKSKISGELPQLVRTIEVDEDELARLRQIKIWNRFVNYSDQQKTYLGIIERQDKLTVPEAQLAILALRDSGITVSQKMAKLIPESGIGGEDLIQYKKLINRTETLSQSWRRDELAVEPYEGIIRHLFSLDFSESKRLLKEWSAEGVDVLKKAMLLSFFMDDGGKELIVDFLDSETSAKERYYATRLLNLVEGTIPTDLSLARFENANVQDYNKVISNYIKRVKEEEVKDKIGRYGEGRNKRFTYVGYEPNNTEEAMAVLNFLIEAPYFVSFRNFFILINPENWYPIHKNLFKSYPKASLFYSIQCSDNNVRARIGQDYAYSDELADSCLGDILVSLLQAFISDDTPLYLKEGILQISKEMFVAVPSSIWESLYMKVWEKEVLSSRFNQTDARRNDVLDIFINKGLNSLRNKLMRQRIICDVLTNSKKNTSFVINCLYYLNVVRKDRNGDDRLSRAIDNFISQLSMPEEITIAGNIYYIMTPNQIEMVSSKCIEILNAHMGQNVDEVVFRSAQFFMKGSVEGKRVFVEAVCNSPLLWENGVIDSNRAHRPFEYLSITNFVRRIYFDKDSLLRLYNKMKDSLDELVAFYDTHKSKPALGDIDGLLSEMLSFLNYYEKRLLGKEDFLEVRNKVKAYYQEISGIFTVQDGLHSPFEDDMKMALRFIFNNRDSITHRGLVRYINTVINRVLMKNSDGLDTCVAYLRLYLNEGLISKEDEDILDGLVQILDRFTKDVAQECNMELIMTTRDMSKIAKALSLKGYDSKGIKYWIELNKSERFFTNFN
ncbi:SIR2-like domain-containing protein [Bacteroidales bacterium WCE2008]|nr:SIR2-like domain-containing protein [Bacteroidales bacterium WCE2008]